MKKIRKIIYDATVIVTGHTSASQHKTGLFRFSHEILKQLVGSGRFEIYLFDIFFRERELIKFIQSEFPQCKRIKIYSFAYRLLVFPIGNLSDHFRKIEHSYCNSLASLSVKVLKNILILSEKLARKIEKAINYKFRSSKIFSDYDIYYSTYYPVPEVVRKNNRIKKVYTIHDLIPINNPEFFSSSYNSILVREVVDNITNDDYVICVSDSTRNDLILQRRDLPEEKIIVTHLAAADYFHPVMDQKKLQAARDKFMIPLEKKYFLSACTFEPRKNLKTLIDAWDKLLKENKAGEYLLILSGAPYWEKDPLLDKIDLLNNLYGQRIFITGFVGDEDLASLYSDAYAFIYPSFYEGFGLPPLEAMQCGVPVICSDTSSLPEVVGDSGIYTIPGDVEGLALAIKELIKDGSQRTILSEKAVLRASEFTWEKTSELLENVFNLALTND